MGLHVRRPDWALMFHPPWFTSFLFPPMLSFEDTNDFSLTSVWWTVCQSKKFLLFCCCREHLATICFRLSSKVSGQFLSSVLIPYCDLFSHYSPRSSVLSLSTLILPNTCRSKTLFNRSVSCLKVWSQASWVLQSTPTLHLHIKPLKYVKNSNGLASTWRFPGCPPLPPSTLKRAQILRPQISWFILWGIYLMFSRNVLHLNKHIYNI